MARSFEFHVIRYEPDLRRGERVNIGLIVNDGLQPQVHLLNNMSKAQALSPQVRFPGSLRADLSEMFADVMTSQDQLEVIQMGEFSLSHPGRFYCDDDELPLQVDAAMKRLVLPARRPSGREGTTRLHTEIKRQFRQDGVLATDPKEISDHKVVAGFEFPGDEELAADFAYKNGAWHLTQVLDYRSTTAAAAAKKIKEVSLKAIALDQAAKEPDRLLGDELRVKTTAVVWVPEELQSVVAPQLDILEDYCGRIYRFQHTREQAQYWEMMKDLTKHHVSHQ